MAKFGSSGVVPVGSTEGHRDIKLDGDAFNSVRNLKQMLHIQLLVFRNM
jgi:hypothetical protein